jgi:hypothetical protein
VDYDPHSSIHCRLFFSQFKASNLKTRTYSITSGIRRLEVVSQAELRQCVDVRVTKGDAELQRIAALRAEAYYEVK